MTAHLAHTSSLNETCDVCAMHEKELKQTLQFADFIGYNENAVKWQVRIGLLVHLEQACFKGFENPAVKPMGQKKRQKPRKRGVGDAYATDGHRIAAKLAKEAA